MSAGSLRQGTKTDCGSVRVHRAYLTSRKMPTRSSSTWRELSILAKFILIPELESGDLLSGLSAASRVAMNYFVKNGGKLVMFCPGSGDMVSVLNTVFEFGRTRIGRWFLM